MIYVPEKSSSGFKIGFYSYVNIYAPAIGWKRPENQGVWSIKKEEWNTQIASRLEPEWFSNLKEFSQEGILKSISYY